MDINNMIKLTESKDSKEEEVETQKHAEVLLNGDETEKDLAENDDLKKMSQIFSHRLKSQVIYKGMLLNQTTTPKGMDSVQDFEMMDGDVIVCGYPKSGTTWLQEVVYLALTEGDIASARAKPCYIRCPLLEDYRAQTKSIPHMKTPRLMKSHLPFEKLPTSTKDRDIRLIYIIRNPKDVAVSYYYFYQSLSELGNYTGTWNEFLQMYLNGYVMYRDWFTHIKGWWEQCTNHKVLIVSYEEMKSNAIEVIKEIARFLGQDLDMDTVSRIEENTTFNVMQENPSTNFAALKSVFKLPFMRKGQVGDWKNHFSVAQNEHFNHVMTERIHNSSLRNALIFEQ